MRQKHIQTVVLGLKINFQSKTNGLKKKLVILWLTVFVPVRLYGLVKNGTFNKSAKIVLGIIFGFWSLLLIN